MQSAHFMVEPDGPVCQLIDTADIGGGTATYTGRALHIEHAGNGQPFTRQHLHASALLIGWIKSAHPDVPLMPAGTGFEVFDDDRQIGITCHSFVESVAKVANPKLACPGKKIVEQMNEIAVLASVRAAIF